MIGVQSTMPGNISLRNRELCMIDFIVKIIIRYLKGAWQSFRIGKQEQIVNKAKKEAKREVKEANDSYTELMDLYTDYSQGSQGKSAEKSQVEENKGSEGDKEKS